MRIAYLCADFGIPIRGYKGASVHVRQMAAALDTLGHEVRIFSPNLDGENEVAARLQAIGATGLPTVCSRVVRGIAPRRYPRLDKEVRDLAYNVTLYRRALAHFVSWRPHAIYERYSLFNVAGLALARRLGVPHVLEMNAPLRLERARTKGLSLDVMARLIERRLCAGSDAVLPVSRALYRYALEHGARPPHTLLLPNAVDTRRFHPLAHGWAARKRWGLGRDAFVVGFAGSLKPWHGTDLLLDAFATLRRHQPAARLLIVGEGPEGEALRQRAADLGISDATVFTGTVAHDEMPETLVAMDVGVAPYRQVPDFYFSPLKVYEYMASGRAVVASDAGEIASLVRDGQTGLLCPPGDAAAIANALVRLARDGNLRARLAAGARMEAESHTWLDNARAVADLIDALRADRRTAITTPLMAGEGQ